MGNRGEEDAQSADVKLAAKAREQFGLISRSQALACGLSSTTLYRRVCDGWLCAERHGVYRYAAVPWSWHQSVMAVCLQIPGGVACGRTAGWLHGLDGLGTSPPSRLEVAVERTRDPRCADVRIYRVRRLKSEWTYRDGIPVTHLPRTLIDLAGLLSEQNAELALDSALRGRPGVRGWLTRVLEKYPPNLSGGPRVLRELMKLRTTPSDSGLEVKFERLLRKLNLPEPTYRRPVFDGQGRIASVDYVWSDQRVVVQTHGWQWHGHRPRWQTDISQRRRMSVDGWCVIEITSVDLRDHLAEIIALLRRGLKTGSQASAAPPFAR